MISCRTTHQEGAQAKPKKRTEILPTTVAPTQTGSYLPRHAYVSEETKLEDERRDREKKERKAKQKLTKKEKKPEKDKSVDEDYVPRGGFR